MPSRAKVKTSAWALMMQQVPLELKQVCFRGWESRLTALTEDQDQHVREFSIIALSTSKNPRARDTIERILGDTTRPMPDR